MNASKRTPQPIRSTNPSGGISHQEFNTLYRLVDSLVVRIQRLENQNAEIISQLARIVVNKNAINNLINYANSVLAEHTDDMDVVSDEEPMPAQPQAPSQSQPQSPPQSHDEDSAAATAQQTIIKKYHLFDFKCKTAAIRRIDFLRACGEMFHQNSRFYDNGINRALKIKCEHLKAYVDEIQSAFPHVRISAEYEYVEGVRLHQTKK